MLIGEDSGMERCRASRTWWGLVGYGLDEFIAMFGLNEVAGCWNEHSTDDPRMHKHPMQVGRLSIAHFCFTVTLRPSRTGTHC